MKKGLIAILIAVVAAAAAACSKAADVPEGAIKIYCTDMTRSSLNWEYYVPVQTDPDALLEEIMGRLDTDPEDTQYCRVKPGGVNILGCGFGQDGQLQIDFSENYLRMDVVTELLCRAGIVKTLCQLDDIEYVEFTVGGHPLMLRNENYVGQMCDEDFIDNTGENVQFRQKTTLTIYYADESGTMLNGSSIVIESDGVSSVGELALSQLISGPPAGISGVLAPLPADTGYNKVSVRDGVAYVDFNSVFLKRTEDISDETTVYSVVNTLCEIPTVTKVCITVDGEPLKNYGPMELDTFLQQRPELIRTEKAGEAVE